jgi:hypothetical protein
MSTRKAERQMETSRRVWGLSAGQGAQVGDYGILKQRDVLARFLDSGSFT